MKQTKRARLEGHGWRVGSAQEFLGLSAEEALVETKLRLSRAVRERRAKLSQSQAALAKRLNSSQSRVAKLEAADPNMSVDLLLNALFALLMDAAGISDVPSDRSRYPRGRSEVTRRRKAASIGFCAPAVDMAQRRSGSPHMAGRSQP